MSIRVIGVGTAHGDDAVGLRVAEAVARGPLPEDVRVLTCERGADLLDAVAGARAAVIVDAMRSGGVPGAVRRVPLAALAATMRLSSHALGVNEALALAQLLGRAPARVELVGIEAGPALCAQLSPAVAASVAAASELVRSLVDQIARAPQGR